MHSFLVNIRICQPHNSENHFRGLTNPDVNLKRMHQLYNVEYSYSLFLTLTSTYPEGKFTLTLMIDSLANIIYLCRRMR